MKLTFSTPFIQSCFQVGDRVNVEIATLYKKPPYESIEGTIYQVRIDFPLIWATKRDFEYEMSELKFRYGVQPDTMKFPKMKEVENELYDLPEEYLSLRKSAES